LVHNDRAGRADKGLRFSMYKMYSVKAHAIDNPDRHQYLSAHLANSLVRDM
jgi:hypothetical protein